jgi:hypothetical protein
MSELSLGKFAFNTGTTTLGTAGGMGVYHYAQPALHRVLAGKPEALPYGSQMFDMYKKATTDSLQANEWKKFKMGLIASGFTFAVPFILKMAMQTRNITLARRAEASAKKAAEEAAFNDSPLSHGLPNRAIRRDPQEDKSGELVTIKTVAV